MEMKPILFNTEMVRAILEGRKCVTRRTIKWGDVRAVLNSPARRNTPDLSDRQFLEKLVPCRYEVGDILYVRECWSVDALPMGGNVAAPMYTADYTDSELRMLRERRFRWHPSIHMPKELARIFLRVVDVSARRLQEITADEALSEGVEITPNRMTVAERENYYTACFGALWDTTNKTKDKPLYGWDGNPWVWVIKFERCEKPEGTV